MFRALEPNCLFAIRQQDLVSWKTDARRVTRQGNRIYKVYMPRWNYSSIKDYLAYSLGALERSILGVLILPSYVSTKYGTSVFLAFSEAGCRAVGHGDWICKCAI